MTPTDPVAGPAEAAERVALGVAITGTGLTLEIALEAPVPNGAGIAVGAVLLTNSVANIVPSGPFHNSKSKWDEVASHLRDLKSDLTDEADNVSREWEGPGAEAFDNYLRNKILPTLDTLASAAEQAGGTCETIAGDVETAFEFFVVSSLASIIAAAAANSLLAVPFAGPGLVAAAKWIVGSAWIMLTITDIWMMIGTIMMNVEQSRALETEYNSLIELFGSESDRLDQEALERDRAEVEEVMEDTGGWNKP